jgi:hypothetical protein
MHQWRAERTKGMLDRLSQSGIASIREPITSEFRASIAAPRTNYPARSFRAALLILAIVATAVVTPMFFRGNASGHDFEFHLASWLDAAGQWHEGILFPRWTEWANWGFGEPRFIFYPPASWMAGAALGSVLSWRMAPGAFIWLSLILAGASMWRLAREWLPDTQATAAAVFFAANPYHLVVVYYRSDFAELLASAMFPLVVWAVLRVNREESWTPVPILATAFAAIWLSNAPAAVITTYSLGPMLLAGAFLRRSVWPLIRGGTAMAAGFGVAAFYILPAAWEQRWVQISQVLSENLHFDQNFLFTHANDPEFVLFNWKVSAVALTVIMLTAIAAVFAARARRDFPELWWMLLSLGAASVFFMFPLSSIFWRHLPELRFVQFPWRWLVPLDAVFAFFVAAAAGRSSKKWFVWIALSVALVAFATVAVPDAWWDSEDIPVLQEGIRSGSGYEGTDEYQPAGSDRYSLPENAPQIAMLDPKSENIVPVSAAQISITQWSAEDRDFSVDSTNGITLAPRLLNFPPWTLRVDGQIARADSLPQDGQLLVPVPAGKHQIKLHFGRTWDRTVGAAISLLTALVLMIFAVIVPRRKTRTSPY